VAFHVDYWDYIGWKDRFADPSYARRQYDYQRAGLLSTVYTPGMMRNGKEWRSWRWTTDPVEHRRHSVGTLTIDVANQSISAKFAATQKDAPFILNIALIGMNKNSEITAGENTGKILSHDFIVIEFQQHLTEQKDNPSWQLFELTNLNKSDALVAWITTQINQIPLQVTGGLLR
jgi:hypothetical protein